MKKRIRKHFEFLYTCIKHYGIVEILLISRYLLSMTAGAPVVIGIISKCFTALQSYFQRVLSARSGRQARIASYVAALVCALFAILPVWIGAIGKRTDWPSVPTFARNVSADESALILPLVLQHLTPRPVAIIGLAAIAAAAMSSADSVVLSCCTTFTHNLYRGVVRPTVSFYKYTMVNLSLLKAILANSRLKTGLQRRRARISGIARGTRNCDICSRDR